MPSRPPDPAREPSRMPVYLTFAIGVVAAIAFTVWKLKPREPEEPTLAPQPAATAKVEQTTQNR